MEFLLDFLHYLYNYYMVCALFSHAYHVTHHVTSCGVTLWHPIMWLWLHDTCDVTLSHTLSYVVSSREKEKKRSINNDLTVFTKLWHPIKDINEYLNKIISCFNSTHTLFSPGSRVVNHFSSRITFHFPFSSSNEDTQHTHPKPQLCL